MHYTYHSTTHLESDNYFVIYTDASDVGRKKNRVIKNTKFVFLTKS